MQEQLWLDGFRPTQEQERLQNFVDAMIEQMDEFVNKYNKAEQYMDFIHQSVV